MKQTFRPFVFMTPIMISLLAGCATPEDLAKLEGSMGRRCDGIERNASQLEGRMQSVEKSTISHSTRIQNLEEFKSAQNLTNAKINETVQAINALNAKLQTMEGDLRKTQADTKKALGLTEDFFSSSETLQTQMSQVRQRIDLSIAVLLERLRTEREALDQAIKQIEAKKEQKPETQKEQP